MNTTEIMDTTEVMDISETIDMSDVSISSHAIGQYKLKCFPNLDLLEIIQQMRERLKALKKINLYKKNHPESEYYIDQDNTIYVIKKNKVITTYPNQRIFKPNPIFSNKKPGNKWR